MNSRKKNKILARWFHCFGLAQFSRTSQRRLHPLETGRFYNISHLRVLLWISREKKKPHHITIIVLRRVQKQLCKDIKNWEWAAAKIHEIKMRLRRRDNQANIWFHILLQLAVVVKKGKEFFILKKVYFLSILSILLRRKKCLPDIELKKVKRKGEKRRMFGEVSTHFFRYNVLGLCINKKYCANIHVLQR